MSLFSQSAIKARQTRASDLLSQHLKKDECLIIESGEPIGKPGGLDQTYPFLPHPDYFWLSGSRRAGGCMAYSPDEGWIHFQIPITASEELWEGIKPSQGFDHGIDPHSRDSAAEFNNWVQKYRVQYNLGQTRAQNSPRSDELNLLQESLNEARRIKDSEEIALIERVAKIASKAYQHLRSKIRPGISERELQLEFEHAALKAGSEKFPYDTIIGSGPNAAVLHAIPTHRTLRPEELVLIDAGADIQDYCVDITRVYPASGQFTSQQKDIYDIVAAAQKACIDICRPGQEWLSVHMCAARVIVEGLKNLNLMTGETAGLLESAAVALFFPHGVGHMVGLKVRDVGGSTLKAPRQPGGVRLRVDLDLQKNFIMTVEPGVYFIESLLNNPQNRQKFRTQINWQNLESWSHFGGIRLEDDILVTESEPQNLTSFII